MVSFKETKDALTDPANRIHWIKLVVAFAGLIGISFALAAFLNILIDQLNIDLSRYTWLAYISIFLTSLLANVTIIAPVPFAIVIMAGAAQHFNPVLVALFAAAGGSLGELSGYFAGRLGRKIAIPEKFFRQKHINYWVEKYGFWAITLIAFQPIIPFDVGGMAAGAGKMPVIKFLPALFLGKFPKYIILVYASLGFINFLPGWMIH